MGGGLSMCHASDVSTALPPPPATMPMLALATFVPEHPLEMAFEEGDTVYVVIEQPAPDGWWWPPRNL